MEPGTRHRKAAQQSLALRVGGFDRRRRKVGQLGERARDLRHLHQLERRSFNGLVAPLLHDGHLDGGVHFQVEHDGEAFSGNGRVDQVRGAAVARGRDKAAKREPLGQGHLVGAARHQGMRADHAVRCGAAVPDLRLQRGLDGLAIGGLHFDGHGDGLGQGDVAEIQRAIHDAAPLEPDRRKDAPPRRSLPRGQGTGQEDAVQALAHRRSDVTGEAPIGS